MSGAGSIASSLITNNATFDVSGVNGGYILASGQTLTGSGSVTGGVTVASGATLKGTGTYNGPVTIQGLLSPGNSPGIQTETAGLSFASTGQYNWELISNALGTAGTDYDQIQVTGGNVSIDPAATLNLLFASAGSTVSFTNPFWTSDHTWTILENSGSGSTTGLFGTLTSDTAYSAYGSFAVVLTAKTSTWLGRLVPEPGTLALAATGLLGPAGLRLAEAEID